ncbi:hypothetical protein [Methylocella sp.]|uniref:hypothetical protein n=1 Tax=Methylocella sp. TaxID=1978226 RepID=UPI00378524A9
MADRHSFLPPPAVALGAGLASALLFGLVSTASTLAVGLAYLSSLPLMLAMIGFGPAVGLGAGLVACASIGLAGFFQAETGAVFAGLTSSAIFIFALAGPALFLSYLLCRGAPVDRIVGLAAACAAAVGFAIALVATARYGGFYAALDRVDAVLTPALEAVIGEAQLPDGVDLRRIARAIALAAPPAVAASTLLMLLINLWLAARAAQASGQLPRPWPDLPSTLGLPFVCAPIFAACLVAAFIGGLPGLAAAIVAASLAMGFALEGLAVVHELTRGSAYRGPVLTLVYVALFVVVPPWLLGLFVFVGLAEQLVGLRERRRRSRAAALR